ncbi:MAG: hypothetical protein A2X64_03650 [Ignavibacteria bacterium GWF2_33_9]|nr:MAG: hypothetical protein A2X64_03650 [Ignavibacteria bacterium GWF2_33_9]
MENTEHNKYQKQFSFRLDFYWKALSLYAMVLSIAILIEEFFAGVKSSKLIYQPLIFLMILFVILTSLTLLYQIFRRKKLSINDEGITISFRNHSKTILWEKVLKIYFVFDKINKKKTVRLIKLKIINHRYLRINPNAYEHETELISILEDIKSKYNF